MSRAVIVDEALYPTVAAASDALGLPYGRLNRALIAKAGEVDGHKVAYADEDARRMMPTTCPRCGCATAVQRFRLTGTGAIFYNLEERTFDAQCLHDNVKYVGGTVLYCSECGRRLGSVEDAYDFKEDMGESV